MIAVMILFLLWPFQGIPLHQATARFPKKEITIIVAFALSGARDIIARGWATRWAGFWRSCCGEQYAGAGGARSDQPLSLGA
jgi:tripartite-type tricarboxylate transporter receptor subunit TctC